jgi:26S proteasome regulatory subunit N9
MSLPPLHPTKALEYVESMNKLYSASNPVLAAHYAEIADLYSNKYWHQLTTKLQYFVSLSDFDKGDELLQLYNNFLREFESRINPLAFAQIGVKISRQFQDGKLGLEFIQSLAERLKVHKEAYVTLITRSAALKLQSGSFDEVKKIIEEGKTLLSSMTGVDAATYSAFYLTASEYHKQRGTPAEFYDNGLLYLAYTPLETLSDFQKRSLAFDLSLAALVGEGIYNFGELLGQPIMDSLKGTVNEWIVHFLAAFNSGSIAKYESLVAAHQAALLQQPALVANQLLLKEKISILALIELISGTERTVSFQSISKAVNLPLNEIEILVMKALSLGLVKGKIDEVEQKVTFSWVKPRVLDKTQINQLRERLSKWIDGVDTTHIWLENETPEFVA